MIENQDIQQVDGKTPQFRTELARQLEDLVPEAIADGKVDVAKLKELLQEDAGDTNERFGLFWPGKKRAMRAAQDPTTATLKPAKELSKDWDTTQNIFIEGDNLEVLKVLQKQYHNSIKIIYIDPPYNTGKDFVYPDNFKEGLQNYLEFSKQVDEGNKKISTNTETAGRYHSNWLNMMYPRLKLARNLLTDDGVIFISIDDNEKPHLRKLCDEIYGENNFVGVYIKQSKVGGGSDSRHIVQEHEYCLVYARNISKTKEMFIAHDEEYLRRYKEEDDRGRFFWDTYARPGLGMDSTLTYEIDMPDGTRLRNRWIRSKERFHRELDDGIVRITQKNDREWSVQFKQYMNALGKKPRSMTMDFGGTAAANLEVSTLFGDARLFDYPKSIKYIKKLMSTLVDEEAVILDFFAGSGTTAHAVMQLNAEDGGSRKHIQVQLPEPTDEKSEAYKAGYRKISDIARERISRAGEKIKADFADKLTERDTPLDVGYRTYQLSDTNFRKWQGSATADLGEVQRRLDLMRDSANDNASEADLLVEVMLKMGLPLTTRTTEQSVSGLTIHQVVHATNDDDTDTSEGAPVFYLNEHAKPTLEQLRAVVTELTPSKLVILEDAFQGDNELKTNLTQTCKSYDVELWTV
jgi:adenine-specific DNA-methyltransferase